MFGNLSALKHRRESEQLEFEIDHPPASLSQGDHIFHRQVTDQRSRTLETNGDAAPIDEERAVYRRHVVDDVVRDESTATGWRVHFKHRLPADGRLVAILHSESHTWRPAPPPEMPDFPRPSADTDTRPDWELARWEQPKCRPYEYPDPDSCRDLSFQAIGGEGALQIVNQFLAGGADGRVKHRLLGVDGWRHAFVALYDGYIIAAAVLEHSFNRRINNYDETLYLTRLAAHPHRPQNTSSWMLGRIRGWLRHHTDYSDLVALAGVDGNTGVCYDGAGFDYDGTCEVSATESTTGTAWTKHRWVSAI